MTRRRDPLLLGVDLGTTAVKAVAYRPGGSIAGHGLSEYELTTVADAVEVSPSTYWKALTESVHQVLAAPGIAAEAIAALAISCQGETLLPIGAQDEPLRDAIVWLDSRATEESDELDGLLGGRHFYEVTGQPSMLPTWPAAKVRWLALHEPAVFEATKKFLMLEDYVILKMTGELVTEGSLATSTCYWDFQKRQWWPEMLGALGIEATQLPSLVEPGTRIGGLLPSVADELGLAPGVAVCTGALDQACGAIGAGNVQPGRLSENTGAAVALCSTVDSPTLDPEMRIPCHYHGIPDRYMLHTFTSGGVILQWFRDQLAGVELAEAKARDVDVYDILNREAARIPAGCDGLVAIPHFQGAMAPESNPDARGAFVGLTLAHTRGHLLRSVMESVVYVIRRNVEVFGDVQGSPPSGIWSLGGGARSPLWKQMEADALQVPVTTAQHHDAACLGAAMLAGIGIGIYKDVVEAADKMVRVGAVYTPDPVLKQVYDDSYGRFRAVYEALWPSNEHSEANR